MKTFIDYHEDCHFPIENLPYGIFSSSDNIAPRAGCAIGDLVLDLSLMETETIKYKLFFKF